MACINPLSIVFTEQDMSEKHDQSFEKHLSDFNNQL